MGKFRAINVASLVTPDGEIQPEGRLIFVPTRWQNGFREGWFAMSTDGIQALAASNMGAEDWKTFAILSANLDWENYVQVNQAELAKQVGLKPSNFSRSLRKLIEMDVLRPGPKVGRQRTFIMSPIHVWRGKPKAHIISLNEWKKNRDTKTAEMFDLPDEST